MNILEEFNQFKEILKDKWLDYYQVNKPWIELTMKNRKKIETSDGGSRPDSDIMLGAISVLEPKSLEKLYLFFLIGDASDTHSVISALGLDFDPDLELKKREEERAKNPQPSVDPDTEYLNQIREQIAKEKEKENANL